MRQTIRIPVKDIAPDAKGVLAGQGIPRDTDPPERVLKLYESAEELFYQLAEPIGLMDDISIDDFKDVFAGEGKNDVDAPLENIFPNAGHLALFSFTLGEPISEKIRELFDGGGIALGYMLDAVASYGAHMASLLGEKIFRDQLISRKQIGESTRVLMYSPGYCGWDISGQQKLFRKLQPADIGITLTDSYLMVPLKSISGVMVAGDRDIHRFTPSFSFCSQCKTRSCRDRMSPSS